MGGNVRGGKDNLIGMRKHFVNLEPGYKVRSGGRGRWRGGKGALRALALAKDGASTPRKSGEYCWLRAAAIPAHFTASSLLSNTERWPSWASSPIMGGIPRGGTAWSEDPFLGHWILGV